MSILKEKQDMIMDKLDVRLKLSKGDEPETIKLIEESEVLFKLREVERSELIYTRINTIKNIIVISIIVALIIFVVRFS